LQVLEALIAHPYFQDCLVSCLQIFLDVLTKNAGAASQGSLLSGFSSADLQRRCNGDGSIALGRFFQGSLRGMAAADGKQSNKSLQQGSLGKTC